MIEFIILAQLLTEPKAPKTPAFSWEQSKPIKSPDLKSGEQTGSSSRKQIEEFEERLFESNR